jgi:hypothetical protein
MISRRSFLVATAGTLIGCSRIRLFETTPMVRYPGLHEGHSIRDSSHFPAPSAEVKTDIAILGSGTAGLTAAWKLAKEGFRNFIVVSGPEFGGNAAGGQFGNLRYPCGAHYLPLPSMESTHVRELLFDLGTILRDPMSQRPYFDESCIVHSPDERLYFRGEWQDGFVPAKGLSADEAAQQERFLAYVDLLKTARGTDGKRVFCVPIALSSKDPVWTRLDEMTVKQWLGANGYTSSPLHWYLNYVCRDEYGAEYDKVSAWSGLHYFASRSGKADNALEGAVLTWPDGLNTLVRGMAASIGRSLQPWQRQAYVLRLSEGSSGVEILCAENSKAIPKTFVIKARRAICAMPLLIASRIAGHLDHYGFDARSHMPSYAPWMVSNFLMNGFPAEQPGVPLAWDNVVYQGRGLGYVVSTHQDIRVAAPPETVFSAYHALSARTPDDARRWLARATPEQLFEEASADLKEVYGFRLKQHVQALDITVRGHAMASPLCGFLSNSGVNSLRNVDGRILFAHSDLSGYSVFEEAAWWGYQAALRILG